MALVVPPGVYLLFFEVASGILTRYPIPLKYGCLLVTIQTIQAAFSLSRAADHR